MDVEDVREGSMQRVSRERLSGSVRILVLGLNLLLQSYDLLADTSFPQGARHVSAILFACEKR